MAGIAALTQSRTMSLVESATNIVVGFAIATVANLTVLPLFGLHPTLSDSVEISLIYTALSLVRSYTLRRFFNSVKSYEQKRNPRARHQVREDGCLNHG